jgi:hypothetical protein
MCESTCCNNDFVSVCMCCIICTLYSVFLRSSIWSWISVFHCVTSSGHEVKLRKHGHGVIMRSSLDVTGLEGLWMRV